MYKLLLTGCALAALTMGASVASAQDFKVTLSGDAKFTATFTSQKNDTNARSVDFRNRFRVWINPEAKGLDGKLTYGARVRLRSVDTAGTETFERAHTYLSGAFGTVLLGNVSSYSDDWTGRGSTSLQRPSDWATDDDVSIDVFNAGSTANGSGLTATRQKVLTIAGTGTSARYSSPFIYGFQVTAGYSPTSNDNNWNFDRNAGTAVRQDAGEFAIHFLSSDKSIADKFGLAYVQALFDYQFASNGLSTSKDWAGYHAGLVVGYENFRIGGGYVWQGKSGQLKSDVDQNDRYGINVGAQYKFGDLMVGAGYNYTQVDNNAAVRGKVKTEYYSAGVRYTLSKGLDLFADYNYVSVKNTNPALLTNNSDNASVFTTAINISF